MPESEFGMIVSIIYIHLLILLLPHTFTKHCSSVNIQPNVLKLPDSVVKARKSNTYQKVIYSICSYNTTTSRERADITDKKNVLKFTEFNVQWTLGEPIHPSILYKVSDVELHEKLTTPHPLVPWYATICYNKLNIGVVLKSWRFSAIGRLQEALSPKR